MKSVKEPASRGRGRPRNPNLDHLVHAAALRLMSRHGIDGTSMEAIAAAAGISKMTLYSRWGSKNDLCLAVLKAQRPPDEIRETDDPRANLTALLAATIELHDAGAPRDILPRLVGEMSNNPELAKIFRERIIEPRRNAVVRTLKRAIMKGQLLRELDVNAVADMLLGPIYYRRLVRGHTVGRKLAATLVSAIYSAYGT